MFTLSNSLQKHAETISGNPNSLANFGLVQYEFWPLKAPVCRLNHRFLLANSSILVETIVAPEKWWPLYSSVLQLLSLNGLVEWKIYRKPWLLSWNIGGSWKFSLLHQSHELYQHICRFIMFLYVKSPSQVVGFELFFCPNSSKDPNLRAPDPP